MAVEPTIKRAVAFIDGQNLFHSAKHAFGYPEASYDPVALAQKVCDANGWTLTRTNFYTGVHAQTENPRLNHYWTTKLAALGTRPDVVTFSRELRYSTDKATGFRTGREKGIDVRIALDLIRQGLDGVYDVAIIFSRDQDLTEAVDEIKKIARQQDRWIKVACAFPCIDGRTRGINRTDWFRMDKAFYDACLDPRDYWPKPSPTVLA